MKTRLASLLALVAALSASALAAPSSAAVVDNASFGFSVGKINLPNYAEITRGTSDMTVRRLMGAAQRVLSPDVWAYSGYHAEVAEGADHGCDTLIVTFADGKVIDLKIVNLHAVTVIAANLKRLQNGVQVAKN